MGRRALGTAYDGIASGSFQWCSAEESGCSRTTMSRHAASPWSTRVAPKSGVLVNTYRPAGPLNTATF